MAWHPGPAARQMQRKMHGGQKVDAHAASEPARKKLARRTRTLTAYWIVQNSQRLPRGLNACGWEQLAALDATGDAPLPHSPLSKNVAEVQLSRLVSSHDMRPALDPNWPIPCRTAPSACLPCARTLKTQSSYSHRGMAPPLSPCLQLPVPASTALPAQPAEPTSQP